MPAGAEAVWAALRQDPGFLLAVLGRHARQAFAAVLARQAPRPAHCGVLVALRVLGAASQQHGAALGIDRSDVVGLVDDPKRRGSPVGSATPPTGAATPCTSPSGGGPWSR
jgi:hypothetical protein